MEKSFIPVSEIIANQISDMIFIEKKYQANGLNTQLKNAGSRIRCKNDNNKRRR